MVNCNPETVSTDYDTADRLYFEPLTFEDVLEVVEAERAAGPVAGVICTLGGQTPLGLAQRLKDAGVPVLGTVAGGDRRRRAPRRVLPGAARHRPARAQARHGDDVRRGPGDRRRRSATRCWSGPPTCSAAAGMEIVYDDATLEAYIAKATDVSPDAPGAGRPVPGGRRRDRRRRALRRHRPLPGRRHGAHRGGRHPLRRLGVRAAADHPRLGATCSRSGAATEKLAARIGVRGLMNVQYALKDDILYVLEANPRASRTVPFVSKATAVQLAKAAARIAVGESIADAAGGRGAAGDRRRHRPARRRADRGQGGGAALPPVPHRRGPRRRHRARRRR